MKNFKLLVVALVAMFGFIACEQHECNDYDHSADLVGTWTCLTADYAEALVIKADGSAVSTGVEAGEYWENVAGNIVVENGKVTMTFEDGDNFEGHFDIVPGVAFSIFNEEGEYMTYYYCKEDLSDEIVGMWVCNDSFTDAENDMLIQTFNEDGTSFVTGYIAERKDFILNPSGKNYKVIGDLIINILPESEVAHGVAPYSFMRLLYVPNGTAYGDLIYFKHYLANGSESTDSWLRIKQSLDLTGKTYGYNTAYVTNAKGADEDFNILGHTFNMANIANGNFDMLFRSELFCVIFPNANTIKQIYRSNGQDIVVDIPITVEGNKVTLDMSASIPVMRKVDMYMFQDADDSQLHMYMPTQSFINYFANMEVYNMLAEGTIDPTDAAAVAKVYADMEARVESINVSFVMKAIEAVK